MNALCFHEGEFQVKAVLYGSIMKSIPLSIRTNAASFADSVRTLCFCPPADGGKTLTFFNNDYKGEFQTVTFEGPEIRKLFYGSFHKVRAAAARLNANCRQLPIDCLSE